MTLGVGRKYRVTAHAQPRVHPPVSKLEGESNESVPVRTGFTRGLMAEELEGSPNERVLSLAFDHCHEMVFATSLRITGNEWDAEDVTQGVYETLAKRLNGIRDRTLIPAFLKRCAVHASLRHLRRKRWWRSPRAAMVTFEHGERGQDAHATSVVRELLGHLDPEERAAVILKYVDQHSHAEVAQLMDTSVSTTRRRLDAARKKLAALDRDDVSRMLVRGLGGDHG